MIRKLICWYKGEHVWTDWFDVIYSDGRTKYWYRICVRCAKQETAFPEKPEVSNQELSDLAHTVLQNIGDKEI